MAENGKTRTLRDLIKMVSRRWQWALLATGLTTILILVSAHYMPKKYTSTAVLQVRMFAVSATKDEKGEEWQKERQVIARELKSPTRVRQVIEKLDLKKGMQHDNTGLTEKGERQLQNLVNNYIKRISVKWLNKSHERSHKGGQINDRISISFTHSNSDLAREVTDELVQTYCIDYAKETDSVLAVTRKAQAQKLEEARDALRKLEKELLEQQTQDLPATAAPIKLMIETLGRQIETYKRDLRVAKVRLNGLTIADKRYKEGDTENSEIPEIEIERDNPEYTRLKNELRETDEVLLRLRGEMRMKDQHPTVQYQVRRKERLEKQLADEPEKISEKIKLPISPRTPEFAVRLEMARTAVEDFEARIEDAMVEKRMKEKLLFNFNRLQPNLKKIKENIEIANNNIQTWSSALQFTEARLANSTAGSLYDIAIIQHPEKQYVPSSPKFMLILGAAIFGGLGVGGGLVFLVHKLDRSISSAEDARVKRRTKRPI